MSMFPKNDVYEEYKKNYVDLTYSNRIPDVTKKITLEGINTAVNCCEKWDTFIDIGAATGHYSSGLVHKFKKGLLVEVDPPKELLLLVEKFKNLSCETSYIEDLKITEFFDFVMLIDIFEHIEDIIAFITQVSRLQTKGGVVYIVTPNPLYCGPAIEGEIHHSKSKNGHHRHYFPHEVDEIMSKEGYRLIREGFEERPLRDKGRQFVKGLARRDVRWNKNPLYQVFRFVFHYPLKVFLWVIEKIIYSNETRASRNKVDTRASTFIYKKIN